MNTKNKKFIVYNETLNVEEIITYYSTHGVVIRPTPVKDDQTQIDMAQFNLEVVKYVQTQILKDGIFKSDFKAEIYFSNSQRDIRINEYGFVLLILQMCLMDKFEIENPKQFLDDFFSPIAHKIQYKTLQEFFKHLAKTQLIAKAIEDNQLLKALDLIGYAIGKLSTSGSFKYRESPESFTILEMFAKKEYSYRFLHSYNHEEKIIDLVYENLLSSTLKLEAAQKSLKEKRMDYTALDLAAFKENDIFINCAIQHTGDITPYMTKSNIQDYKIKNKNVEGTINSSYEKTAIEKVLKKEIAPSSVKNKSKI